MEHKKFELSPSVSIIIAGVIIAASIVFVNHGTATKANTGVAQGAVPTSAKLDIRIPTDKEHIVGSASAPIVLVEYSDFQCPFCSIIYPTLKKIVLGSHGRIAWVMRELPLTTIHPQAEPAAEAAECIAGLLGGDAYWKYTDAIFANQPKLSPEYSEQLAVSFGANASAYEKCVSTKQYQSLIDADANEAASSGGNGTPFTVIVNTKTGKMLPISGALPEAQIIKAISSVE